LEAQVLRVFVVDDYEPFRQFVRSTLGKRQDLQVIGEASDGLEAVRKAQELQPDLIVLDIGLPSLNGIEVARLVRQVCPNCKILLMTQEASIDLAQEAFRLGAMGYVVKGHAGGELLASVEAVCQGRQFVSRGLSGYHSTGATDAQAPGELFGQEVLPSLAPVRAESTHCHEVQFYLDDEAFLSGLTAFIEAGLKAGNPVIAVATECHRKSLLQRLLARGVDGVAAMEQGLYLSLDVDQALSTFMVGDLPDPVRFRKVFGDVLSSAAEMATGKHPRVVACGEFAPILWARGKAEAAVQVEHLTDEIAKACNVDILCGYVLNSFQREQQSYIYEKICAEHSAVCSHTG
jgi:DNA-binding NarL/FixJ family response regulator